MTRHRDLPPVPAPDLSRVEAAARAAARQFALPAERLRHLVGEWLDAAELLLLDGRAAPASLLSLVLSADGRALTALDRNPPATARTVVAVLAGWRDDGMPGAGAPATDRPDGWADHEWDGVAPSSWLVPAAVFHAAALDRLGLAPEDARAWARCGIVDFANAPDVPDVVDPADPDAPHEDPFVLTDADDDPDYRFLACWACDVGPALAPAWFAAGYGPEEAAWLSALPEGDHRKPTPGELSLRAKPRKARPGPPG